MAKAKEELAQSSVPGGFTTTFLASSGDSTDAAIAQVLQSSLKELGITVKIQNVDPSAAHDLQQTQDYEITHSYWTMDIADPDELVTFAVDPAAGGKSFYTSYNNAQVIADTKKAEQTFDEAERQKLYSRDPEAGRRRRLPRLPLLLAAPLLLQRQGEGLPGLPDRQLPHGGRLAVSK